MTNSQTARLGGPTCRTAILAGLAPIGLVLGHALDYLVAGGGPAAARLLASTGHGYWPVAVALAGFVGMMTVFAAVVSGFRLAGSTGARPSTFAVAVRLAAMQSAAFVVIEVVERVVAGADVGDLVGPVLVLGLVVQWLVATVAAVLLPALQAAGERLRRRSGLRLSPSAARPSRCPLRPGFLRPSSPRRGAAGLRGPPSLALPGQLQP
ncbi:MAG: hypothetical protein AB1679_23255 [Actinomycetota bacterium]